MKWHIPYQGKTWIFDDGDDGGQRMSLTELRLYKELSRGLTPTAASQARFQKDGDAIYAALVIARRRAGLTDREARAVDPDLFQPEAADEATAAAMLAELAELRAQLDAEPAEKQVDEPEPADDEAAVEDQAEEPDPAASRPRRAKETSR